MSKDSHILEVAGGHRLGALWETTMKATGLKCYTGHVVTGEGKKLRIGVFPRSEKKEGQPDYDIVISDPFNARTSDNEG